MFVKAVMERCEEGNVLSQQFVYLYSTDFFKFGTSHIHTVLRFGMEDYFGLTGKHEQSMRRLSPKKS
ncbi:hypothetical protein BIW11_04720 [Tropilaelaps mercedesae]|uniref:Uncharacterized protein n=1 Tax=Tropilaelaps mercedesae TaxID=418985 RepID=A0A1V9X2R2_9ACAR|nr:hypothetical protein BIW11_04720 [Tropilaelaps mercedesae]